MMLNAILRLLNNRCPACFRAVGPGAVRQGMRLYCSKAHLEKHLKRGDLTHKTVDRAEGGGAGD